MKKMRIISAAIVAVLAVASCAKERTCQCESTSSSKKTNSSGTTENTSEPSTSTTSYKKIKKSEFKLYCSDSSYESSDKRTEGGEETTYYYKTDTKCEIK